MDKKRSIISIFAVMVFALGGGLVACNKTRGTDPVTHTVIFYGNGGEWDGGKTQIELTVDDGEHASVAQPERASYTFDGWTTTADGTVTVNLAALPILADSEFYAKWNKNGEQGDPADKYTVTFYLNYDGAPNGGVHKTESVESGKTVGRPTDPARDGYVFKGWYADANGVTAFDFSAAVTAGKSAYAVWEKESDPTPGATLTGIDVKTPPLKTTYIAGQTLDLSGLVLSASYSDGTSKDVTTGYTASPANGMALATTDTKVTVTYNGKTVDVSIIVVARAVSKLEISGELTNKTQKLGAIFDPSGLTFTATYNNGDTETVTPTFTSYALDATTGKFKQTGDNIKITVSYGGVTAETEISLKVEQPAAPLHEITFDVSNTATEFASYIDGAPSDRSVEEGSRTSEPDEPTLAGFEFKGWYKDSACTNAWNFATDKMGNADITLYAKWEAKTYNVTYTLGGNATDPATNHSSNPSTYTATDGDIALGTPTREHYNFLGWYTVGGNKVEKIGYERILNITAADIKLEARWQAKTYNISYELGGTDNTYGATLATTAVKTYTYGTARELPGAAAVTIINKDNDDEIPYRFLGWYWEGDPQQKIVSTIPVGTSGDRKYIAKIEKAETWEFTYDCGYEGHHEEGEETVTVVHIVKGQTAEDIDLTGVRPGYIFKGWYDGEGGTGTKHDFTQAVTANTTVYAKWEPIQYTIEYVGDGFTTTMPTTYTLDDTDINLTTPSLDAGYYFEGWYLNEDFDGTAVTKVGGLQFVLDEADDDNNIKIYAKTSNLYTVIYNANKPEGVTETTSGMPASTGKVAYGALITKPTSNPNLSDYGFIGWYTDAECTDGNEFDFDTAIGDADINATAHTVTLYAKWYQKPTSGKYIVGGFNGWGNALQRADISSYKATAFDYDEDNNAKAWRIGGLTLKAGDEFKFIDYEKSTNYTTWNAAYNNANTTTSNAFYIRPGYMTVTLTEGDDPNYQIEKYTIGEGYTWSIVFGTDDAGKTYITFEPDNYVGWRDPKNAGNTPTKATTLTAGEWYFAGNFTDWFSQSDAWSTKQAYKNGTSYHFTKIYLKKYDTFKIMNSEGTWLGGSFGSLGQAFTLGDLDNIELNTIEDGWYNIVFSNGTTKQLTITQWTDVSISGSTTPVYVGDTIEKKHLVVTVGSTTISDYTILGATTPLVSGQNTIRILYRGGVYEHKLTPTEVEVVSMAVTKEPTTKWYWSGSTLSTAGLEITLTYNNGTTKVISGNELATTFDFSANLVGNSSDPILANVVPVTVTLKADEGITISFNVNVVYKATSITATAPTKTEYFVGDALDTKGIVVTAKYGTADGAPTRTATSACTFTPANGATLAADNTSITVTYRQTLPSGCTLTQPVVTCTITGIVVKVPQITAIEIDGSLDDSSYTIGDTFDATGLSFTATYENGDTGAIYANDLTFSFGDEYVNAAGLFKKAGTATLTVTYGTITATSDTPITVTISNKLTSITVDATGLQKPHGEVGFVDGDPLTVDGIVVTAHYNAGIDGAIDDPKTISRGTNGYTVSPLVGTQLSEGANVITISYRGQTATFTITAVAREMTGITVTGTPALQYIGSKLNSTGLTFKAQFNNGDEETIPAADITFTSDAMNDDGNFAVFGTGKTVTATYEGKTFDFVVDVDSTTQYLVQFAINVPGTGKVADNMPADQNVQHGRTVDAPTTNPTLKGYTFDGWYKEAACTTAWNFETETVTGNKTIYAKWISIDYAIMYSVDGSTSALPNADYKANNNLFPELTLATPNAKTGYDFAGWCFKSDLSDTPIHRMTYARIPAADNTVITLYAKYEPKEYTVSFDLRGGTAADAFADQTVKYNESADKPTATPTRKHYDFAFWYVGTYSEGTTTAYDFTTPITEDTIIYARWTAYGYTVQYNLNGGSHSGNPATYSAASGDVTLANATKEGYRFKGWKTATGATVTKLTASMLPDSRADAIVLTADFELIVTHTVTFDLGYEVTNRITTSTVEAGNKVTKPTNPTRRGWKFEYWVDSTDTEFIFADRTITADITLTAKWTQNTVKVYFNYNYGTTPTVTEKTINQYATAASVKPTDPTREGYEFMGWYTNAEGTGTAYAFTAEVSAELTLYAKWEKITGGKLIIGTDERSMYDNSAEFGDEGDLEYKLEGIKLNEGDEISFTIDGVATKVYVDSYSNGLNKPTGLQNSITLTKEGTFSFYLHKRESESNWTIYATYAEYVELTDGIYADGKLIQAFAAHNSGEVKLIGVSIPAGAIVTFVYNHEEVIPSIKSSCPDRTRFDSSWCCTDGGVFDMYYAFGASTENLWVEYKSAYVPPLTVDSVKVNGTEMTDNSDNINVAQNPTQTMEYTATLTLASGATISFEADGETIVVWVEREVNVAITGAGSRTTSFKTKLAGEFTFTLKYTTDGGADKTGGWTVYVDGPVEDLGEEPALVKNAYYLLGGEFGFNSVSGYRQLVNNTITLEIAAGQEFKIARCANATTGAVDWSINYGYGAVTTGKGYITSNADGNMVFNESGTYTIKLNGTKVEITSDDVEEPEPEGPTVDAIGSSGVWLVGEGLTGGGWNDGVELTAENGYSVTIEVGTGWLKIRNGGTSDGSGTNALDNTNYASYSGDNFVVKAAGKYKFTWNPTTKKLTVEPA